MCRVTAVEENVVARPPLLSAHTADGEVRLTAAGAWTAPNAAALERLVHGIASNASASGAAAIDMRGIEQFDTYGALLLERLSRAWEARGQQMRIVALAERYQGLLRNVHGLNHPAVEVGPRESKVSLRPGVAGSRRVQHRRRPGHAREHGGCLGVGARSGSAPAHAIPADLRGASPRSRGLAGGTDHPAHHLPYRRHHLPTGLLPFPQVRRRRIRRGHGRHPRAARDRGADRGHHGGRAVRQLVHGRARLHEDARGDRRPAHHGAGSRRNPAASRASSPW